MAQEKPFNRYTYTFNYDTGEIETPDVFLLDKKLHKLGRLYPALDLNIIVNVVDADEISFTFYKYYNDEEQELYSSLINNSVAFVQGFGCFELKVTETDNENGVAKTVSGQSLAYCELSQITATVEINTEDDIIREDKKDYINDFPTVFYRPYDDEALLKNENYWSDYPSLTNTDKKKILKESSMLHRILSYAPHYRIGHVDKSLYFVQRQFSFDSDINSCLQEIAKEVGCIFTYNIYLDEDYQPVREINAYETCYCTKCYQEVMEGTGNFKTFTTGKYRSISNGICNNCGSSDFVYDYGEDSDVFITTENLTDEIQVQPENEVKNCFKISGGDDLITSTVQALQMSSSNRIVMFSEEQKEQMSDELRATIEQYDKEYNENQGLFEDIVKAEYNVIDLIQYLQSGKMPLLAEDVKDIQKEVAYVLDSIMNDYECNFYVSSYSGKTETGYVNHAYTSASNAIKNLFTLYLDKGYSVRVSNGDNMATSKKDEETYIKWNGVITIYETDDRDNNYANIYVLKDGQSYTDPDGVSYTGTYVEYGAISKPNSNANLIETYNNFVVKLGFGDTNSKTFKSYIEQFCDAKLASYKDVEYKNREEKDWKLYCYERLHSYYDAYEECLNALMQIGDTSTENEKKIVSEMYNSYASIQANIEKQMLIVRNQLNALYQFYGIYPNTDDANAKDYIRINYPYDLAALGISNATDDDFIAVLKDMADNGSQNYIGNKPFACQVCGSSNVGVAERKDNAGNVVGTYNYCKSCRETEQSKITTYGDVARQIVAFIAQHGTRKYVNNYYFDNIGENVYGSYLSPSVLSYQFSLKDTINNSGYILSSYGQNIEPYLMIKTRKTQNEKRYIVNHSSGTCYILENNGDVLDVEVRQHSGGKLINSYTIPSGGIERIYTSNDDEVLVDDDGVTIDDYEVTIDIKQRHQGYINCTIFKCFDPRGDLVHCSPISSAVNYRGRYVWCSYETYNKINILCEANSIDSIYTERNKLSEYFSLERYLGEDLYKELMLYIREDKYENSNYTSDGCLTNAQLVDKAKELLTKAKQELAKACRQQYSISSNVYSIVATKYRNWSDNDIRMKIYDEFDSFKLGNWIRARLDNVNYHGQGKDDSFYKMRLMSIQFDFENIDSTNVTYSNVERNTPDLISKIQDTLASASSMATTYDYVATQAEQGEVAKQRIDNILQNGFDSALAAIKAGENQDITMDRHGLLFRQYLPEMDAYSQYQMKMINRNIVMTSDNWQTASLAIGLGLYNGEEKYGIWAGLLCGDLIVGKELIIKNDNSSVIIDENGITLDGGAITWTNKAPIDSIKTEYMTSSSGTNAPSVDDSNWSDSIPDITDGKYLWCKTTTTDASGESAEPEIVCLGGSDNIEETWIEYAFSEGKDSENEPNDTSWFKNQPTYSEAIKDLYIWTRTTIKYMSGKITYTDVAYNSAITNSILSYNEFKDNVHTVLGISGTTTITKDSVISPKIAAQYLYVTKDNYSVEIDPSHSAGNNTLNGYLFTIRDKSKSDDEQVIMGVDTSGNGYFSGEINATSGYIGGKTGWTIDGTTIINKSGDAVIQTGKLGSSYTQIRNGSIYTVGRMSSETAWLNLNMENGTLCCSRTLSNTYKYSVKINSDMMEMVDADGNLWLKANSEQNNITLGINTTSIDMEGNTIFHNSATFNNTTRYNSALRLYASSTSNDYSELSFTSLSSSGADAYLLVKSSMAIGYRLQVGDANSFDKNHTFRVDGTSYVTGTSYTNSGTTVTSDKNKKNSISSPADNYVALFDSLEFRRFKYNDGTSDRFHLGVIAQELEEAMNSVGLSSKDFGGLVIDKNSNYFVRYDEINTLTALKVKQLESKIKKLEEELKNTKSNIE